MLGFLLREYKRYCGEACGSWLALAVRADPLRLQAFARDLLDGTEGADREMLERRRHHVVARVVLAPSSVAMNPMPCSASRRATRPLYSDA